MLARISIPLEPVAAAERSEKTPVPLIDKFEVDFYRFLDLFRSRQCFPQPVYGRGRRITLSCSRGSIEQRGDLAQLLAVRSGPQPGTGFQLQLSSS